MSSASSSASRGSMRRLGSVFSPVPRLGFSLACRAWGRSSGPSFWWPWATSLPLPPGGEARLGGSLGATLFDPRDARGQVLVLGDLVETEMFSRQGESISLRLDPGAGVVEQGRLVIVDHSSSRTGLQ